MTKRITKLMACAGGMLGAVALTAAAAQPAAADTVDTLGQTCTVTKDHVPFYDAPAGKVLGWVNSGQNIDVGNTSPDGVYSQGKLWGGQAGVWIVGSNLAC